MLSLSSQLNQVSGIGPTLARRLSRLNLHTIQDLGEHLPARYEDFSSLTTLSKVKVGEQVTLCGKIQIIKTRRTWRRRLTITEALISDGHDSVKAVWFNQPYLAQTLKPGDEIMLAGKLSSSSYGLQIEHPVYETAERAGIHTGRLVPIYPLNSELTQRALRNLLFKIRPLLKDLPEWLPDDIRQAAKLPSLAMAIDKLHWPTTWADVTAGRRRIIFNELFLTHLQARLARQKLNQSPAPVIPFSPQTKELVSQLPWTLTQDQKISAWEIIKDLGKSEPMFRLLQGDVGSGKTIVAGLAALNAALAGWQTALIAPTEILAQQHFISLSKLFKTWPITVGLLTRGQHQLSSGAATLTASKIKQQTANGNIQLLVGTHAVLQKTVTFHKLGLVIVDEQHRFGVEQRQNLLINHQITPHLLSLSATPIPRSLALTIYGDLDISLLKTLPAGRQPITTTIVPPNERSQAYQLIRQEINKGHRAFIICPLIDESDILGVRAATQEHERLAKEIFPDFKIGLLHGKLSSQTKAEVMQKFKQGATPILVSTSVVEVGVDVPEATVMTIEGADRFGLAQLHQFRGRVGRSERRSWCLLLTDNTNPQALKRLQALVKYPNGFDLAEFDLKSRGPGDLLGQTQSGFLKLRWAELANQTLLTSVRQQAKYLLDLDPTLKLWPKLKTKLGQLSFHPE
jgi:ATP-dependent DNA helicase RecG